MKPDHRFLDDLTETSTRVEPALVTDDPDKETWDADCDVLVVGVGLAGVCAALRTSEDKNLQVIAIDRGEGGGASRLSGGVVYMGGGTRAQKEAGIEDTPENMANYLAFETGNLVRLDTVQRFAEASVHFQDWLESYGARFGGPATDEKTSYPETASIYYSGNELTVPGRERAKPAPRGHRAKPAKGGEPTDLSGQYLLPPLIESMESQPNVRFFRQTRATRMIVDGDGAVVGLEVMRIPPGFAAWRHAKYMSLVNNLIVAMLGMGGKIQSAIAGLERNKAKSLRIRVRKGVVLSAGGFTYNRTMMAKTAPDYLESHPLGTIADDGSGIKLGMTVGARTDLLDRISAWRFLYPPESWTNACSVGPDGERLVGQCAISNVIRAPVFLSCTIGYDVDEHEQGRGIATRLVRHVAHDALTTHRLHRVEAGTLVSNLGSQRVLEKCGFTRIGIAPRHVRIAGRWQDHVLYVLTAEDLS